MILKAIFGWLTIVFFGTFMFELWFKEAYRTASYKFQLNHVNLPKSLYTNAIEYREVRQMKFVCRIMRKARQIALGAIGITLIVEASLRYYGVQ